jgi:hypothetical protein
METYSERRCGSFAESGSIFGKAKSLGFDAEDCVRRTGQTGYGLNVISIFTLFLMANPDIRAHHRHKSLRETTTCRTTFGTSKRETNYRGLYGGLIRLHVLHHSAKQAVYGFATIEELRCHGYELSTGTLYPILHGLERDGLLTSIQYIS